MSLSGIGSGNSLVDSSELNNLRDNPKKEVSDPLESKKIADIDDINSTVLESQQYQILNAVNKFETKEYRELPPSRNFKWILPKTTQPGVGMELKKLELEIFDQECIGNDDDS